MTALTSPDVAARSHEPGGLGRGHRQGLLADDVLAGLEDRRRLRDVEVVRRRDVDDLDGSGPQGSRRGRRRHGGRSSASARAAPRSAVLPSTPRTVHADPAQLLDVDGPDEPGADDGGADAREPAQRSVITGGRQPV